MLAEAVVVAAAQVLDTVVVATLVVLADTEVVLAKLVDAVSVVGGAAEGNRNTEAALLMQVVED